MKTAIFHKNAHEVMGSEFMFKTMSSIRIEPQTSQLSGIHLNECAIVN
jgi:hypothetical protein